MRAVTFQAPGAVAVQDRPEPELESAQDAIVAISATGICGSDLHIYRGRVRVEPGFTLGHEFVGRVIESGHEVRTVQPGDRVLGCFHTACGRCFFCLRGSYQRCERIRVFGHGSAMGGLPGTQAERALVPMADMTLRKVPEGLSDELALFAGDVMGTGYHAVAAGSVKAGDSVAIIGLGPVGLCAVQAARAAGAALIVAIDTVKSRLRMAERFGATALHLTEDSPRDAVKAATASRGVDVAVDAVGHPDAFGLAIRLVRGAGTVVAIGVYAEPCEVHMGLVWIKGLTINAGLANVIGHVDRVLAMMSAGTVDPSALVTHHMPLEDAPAAYELFDRREALKVVLAP